MEGGRASLLLQKTPMVRVQGEIWRPQVEEDNSLKSLVSNINVFQENAISKFFHFSEKRFLTKKKLFRF